MYCNSPWCQSCNPEPEDYWCDECDDFIPLNDVCEHHEDYDGENK